MDGQYRSSDKFGYSAVTKLLIPILGLKGHGLSDLGYVVKAVYFSLKYPNVSEFLHYSRKIAPGMKREMGWVFCGEHIMNSHKEIEVYILYISKLS